MNGSPFHIDIRLNRRSPTNIKEFPRKRNPGFRPCRQVAMSKAQRAWMQRILPTFVSMLKNVLEPTAHQ
jgi:hypothetical protein